MGPGSSVVERLEFGGWDVAELLESSGAAGRFGLAGYTLRLPPGFGVLSPRVDPPCMDPPCVARPDTARPEESGLDVTPARSGRRRSARPAGWSQGALDLGTGDE